MLLRSGEIQAAAERISGAIIQTPCPHSIPLSEATGMRIHCKLEYLQRTGSFKERGARNALLLLSPEQKQHGVIAASAGNHALALAWHGRLLEIPIVVVMPRYAPLAKVANCRRFGAEVILHGNDIAQARSRADLIAADRQLTYINGYDDAAVIAGQGTLALEIMTQVPDLDAIVVPIGGAGLIAGVATAIKENHPHVRVIGVEAERAASFTAAIKSGKPVPVPMLPTVADGLAVPTVGERGFNIARRLVDRAVLVRERDLAVAILRLLELEKAVVEGAGAAPLAACLAGLLPELQGKTVVLPLCGGNIDTATLGRILERGLASDGRLCRLTATISDRPGGLAHFAEIIAREGASIHDIHHDRAFASEDVTTVTVRCILETHDAAHIARVRDRLIAEGFPILESESAPPAGGQ